MLLSVVSDTSDGSAGENASDEGDDDERRSAAATTREDIVDDAYVMGGESPRAMYETKLPSAEGHRKSEIDHDDTTYDHSKRIDELYRMELVQGVVKPSFVVQR